MISKGSNVQIFEPSTIQATSFIDSGGTGHDGELKIGDNTQIQPFCTIIAKEQIVIGRNCSIASGVRIYDHDHNLEDVHSIQEDGKIASVTIGDYCWIGANVVILKGVELANYCVVGAGAIVTKSFPEGSILVGNPARLLRKREICTKDHAN